MKLHISDIITDFSVYFILYVIMIPSLSLYGEKASHTAFLMLCLCFMSFYIIICRNAFHNYRYTIRRLIADSWLIVFCALAMSVLNYLTVLAKQHIGIPPHMGSSILAASFLDYPLIYGIYICIITPAVEELAFRWVFLRKWNISPGMQICMAAISSLLFSLLHIINEIASGSLTVGIDFIYYFVFSIVCFLLYRKEGSIMYSTAFHVICNMISLMFLLI